MWCARLTQHRCRQTACLAWLCLAWQTRPLGWQQDGGHGRVWAPSQIPGDLMGHVKTAQVTRSGPPSAPWPTAQQLSSCTDKHVILGIIDCFQGNQNQKPKKRRCLYLSYSQKSMFLVSWSQIPLPDEGTTGIGSVIMSSWLACWLSWSTCLQNANPLLSNLGLLLNAPLCRKPEQYLQCQKEEK